MRERKDDGTGELDDENLADVTGGIGVVTAEPSPAPAELGGPDTSPPLAIEPRDAASGLPTGKRMHKPMVITKDPDPTMS